MLNVRLSVCSLLVVLIVNAAPVRAQNPIQWQGNAQSAVALAREQGLPLLVWVAAGRDIGDDDDLRDAQEESFRDPDVRNVATRKYVPLRVYRNSRSLEEMQRLGLPTNYAFYLAVITSDGKVLDQVDPGQVTRPELLAARLVATFETYCEGVYQRDLRPVIVNPESKKEDVREALRTAWRLGVSSADKDVAALLDRKDITPAEKRKLYSMLASLATPASVAALLDRADLDPEAAQALGRAEAGALETLLKQLPGENGEPTKRQLSAYRATVLVARAGTPKPDAFWKDAKPEMRSKELQRVNERAGAVLDFWREHEGKGGRK
jgi:hypothetical protein